MKGVGLYAHAGFITYQSPIIIQMEYFFSVLFSFILSNALFLHNDDII